MDSQQNQTNRVLSMYDRLSKGHMLTKKTEADLFHVSEKTIQRDFDSIRDFIETTKPNEYLEYDRQKKGIQVRNK